MTGADEMNEADHPGDRVEKERIMSFRVKSRIEETHTVEERHLKFANPMEAALGEWFFNAKKKPKAHIAGNVSVGYSVFTNAGTWKLDSNGIEMFESQRNGEPRTGKFTIYQDPWI